MTGRPIDQSADQPVNPVLPDAKTCSKCKTQKYLHEFAISKDHKYGISNKCRACRSEYSKSRRKNNLEKVRKEGRDSQRRNIERVKAYQAKRTTQGLNRGKGGWAKWRAENPFANRSNAAKQRAAKRKVMVEKIDLLDIFERDNWTCYICGIKCDPLAKRATPFAAEADHVVPLSRGGEHSVSNLRCSCFPCNRTKGAREISPPYLCEAAPINGDKNGSK